jgi:N-acetylmuramoyl-L-alanine amidase
MNKYKSLIIVMFFFLIFSLSKVNSIVNDTSLLGKIIYLDAGHGGTDSGAISKYILEKDLNLILVKKLEKKLIARGAIVYLTREDDYELTKSTYNRKRNDLYNRAKLINNSDCDLYISIHLNSTTSSSWKGIQIFYNSKLEKNKALSESINDILKKNISNVRDIKNINNYYMYRLTNKPGTLIEAGFISNPNDNYNLRQEEYQNKLTESISLGVVEYFSRIQS